MWLCENLKSYKISRDIHYLQPMVPISGDIDQLHSVEPTELF
jgi:hypothetical protein